MRISKKTQQIICDTTQEIFGEKVSVSLFGSRANDELKGGDIDLLVQSEVAIASRQQKKLQLVARLQMRLGDQPIDVIALDPTMNRSLIYEEALRTGIKL